MPTQRLERWVYNGTVLTRPGRPNRSPNFGFVDTFVLGVTDPSLNPGLVGAGVIRPITNLTPITGTTITVASGDSIVDRIIEANVNITGTGYLENCLVRGRSNGSTGDQRAIINTDGATPIDTLTMAASEGQAFGSRGFNVRFCTIRPQVPSAYQGGIGNKNARTYRNLIEQTTDGFASFSQTVDGLCRNYDEGTLIRDLVQWRPDAANGNRSHTHNDGEQLQGNLGDRYDVYRRGTAYVAGLSTVYGTQPVDDPRQHISCVTTSLNTQSEINGTWEQVFFWKGIAGFNGGGTSAPGSHLALVNCRFQRPGVGADSPSWAAAINSSITRTGTGGNRYHDSPGSGEVPVGTS